MPHPYSGAWILICMSVTLYAVQLDWIRFMWSVPGTSHGYTSLFKATSMYWLLHVTVTPADVMSLGPKMIKDVNIDSGPADQSCFNKHGKGRALKLVCYLGIGRQKVQKW